MSNLKLLRDHQLVESFDTIDLPAGWRRTQFDQSGELVTVLHADHPADELRLPLNGNGPAALHLGMVNVSERFNSAMQVRVDPDGAWRRVRPMRFVSARGPQVQDGHLGTFDLNPQSVLRIRTEPNSTAGFAYVRSSHPAGQIEPRHKRNAAVVFDTNMTMSDYRIDEPDDLLTVMRPYVDSDFSDIFWGTTVGTYSPLYFSDILAWHGKEKLEYGFDHRIATARVMRMFAERGVDPFQLAIDFAHSNGLKIWANYRISKNHDHDFTEDCDGGRFLCRHRDKLVRERDGSPHHQVVMSFAYAEIRQMAIAMLVEQAKYDVDGLFIDFCRKYPLVGWEQPVVESFKHATRHDPQTQPVEQWRVDWYRHLCSYVTQFLRELREALKPVEQQRGARISIAVQVPGGWRFNEGVCSCMADAMDPITWAKEGLVQVVAPSQWSALMLEPQCFDRMSLLLQDTGCKLWGAIGPQFAEGFGTTQQRARDGWLFADADPWRIMSLAHDFYQQGADGMFIWEAQEIPNVPQRWDVIRRIGDREYLKQVFGNKLGRFDGSHWIAHSPLMAL